MDNPDRELANEVRAVIARVTDLDMSRMRVRSERGVILLSGRVFSDEEKRLVEEVAARLVGVRGVINDLEVRS